MFARNARERAAFVDGVFEVSSGSRIQNHAERSIDGDFLGMGNKEFWLCKSGVGHVDKAGRRGAGLCGSTGGSAWGSNDYKQEEV
jgi:hypothetical protein